jgi:hypothetical protein
MIAGRHPPQTVPAPHLPATALKVRAPSWIADATASSVMPLHRQMYNSVSCQFRERVSPRSQTSPIAPAHAVKVSAENERHHPAPT